MTVPLPLLPKQAQVAPKVVRYGGDLVSALGGPTQRISRIGTRFAVDVQLPTLDAACAGRWIAAMNKADAIGDTVSLIVPQLGDGKIVGAATGIGAVGATELEINGGFGVAVGLLFSFVAGGRSYLHQVTDVVDSGTIGIAPALRVAINGVTLNFATPTLEGFIDATAWSVEFARFVGQSFSLAENA
jgi:hypothetical protein